MANKSLGSWTVGIGVSDVQFKDGLAKIEVQATGFAKRIKGSFSPLTGVFNDLKGMIIGAFSVAAITGAVKYFDGIDASVRKMTVGISNARKGTADFGGIAKDIYTSMPLSIDQATAAVTLLANKTKLTGDAFKEAAKQAGGLAVLTGGNGATSSSLMAMKKWGVNQGDFKQYTDFMYSLTKESGLGAEGIEQLNQELIQTDNTLGKFGFSMGGAAEFLASMTAEGIDTQQVIGSLDKSVKQMVADRKYGVDNLADGWQKMREEIEKAQTPMEKLAIAQQYFGAKGGASEMLDVFEKVKISLDGSSVSMSSVLGDVKDMKTPMEELSEAMKKVAISTGDMAAAMMKAQQASDAWSHTFGIGALQDIADNIANSGQATSAGPGMTKSTMKTSMSWNPNNDESKMLPSEKLTQSYKGLTSTLKEANDAAKTLNQTIVAPASANMADTSKSPIFSFSKELQDLLKNQSLQSHLEDMAKSLKDGFTNTFTSILDGTKKFGDAMVALFKGIVGDLLKAWVDQNISKPLVGMLMGGDTVGDGSGGLLGGLISGIFGNHASGGSVDAGVPSIVGEAGSEIFVPTVAGNIIPHSEIASASGGGGGHTFNTSFSMSPQTPKDMEQQFISLVGKFKDHISAITADTSRRGGHMSNLIRTATA